MNSANLLVRRNVGRHLPVSDYLSHIYHSMPPGLLLVSGEYVAGGDLGPAFDATRQTVSTPPPSEDPSKDPKEEV
jgi:hypothetical protein